MSKNYFLIGRHDRNYLHTQWVSLASQYAPNPSVIESVFDLLVDNYSESARAYHNLSHIQSLIALSEPLLDKIQQPDAHYFAIWFHDAIYNTRRPDNEDMSAEFAAESLTRLGVPEQTIAVVREMVLATKHHRAAGLSWDMKVFLDLDTSILGAPEEIYQEYSRAIRKEYSWVPDVMYREGRIKC
jgi:predicted metal-dependent HD superfamily phosphohydrolase